MNHPLEASIERAVADWPVPGLGCGVIAGGVPLFTRGFGVRGIGGAEPVDDRTLFAIGSVSKSFTGTAIAMLVDEGKLSWDSRVVDHLPNFRLFDPFVTREMTVRDLLTHRSGLERGDFMWYKSGYDADEVMRRAALLAPSWSFRTTFGYQNIMYLAAGKLLEAIAGVSWDHFIETRIFAPLGMTDSHPSLATLGKLENVARPHATVEGTMTEIQPHDGLNVNPAGSIYSNVSDMLAWLQLAIDRGVYKGRRLLSTGASQMTQTPQMPIAQSGWSEMFPDVDFLSYAAGWFVCSYRGVTVVSHGGNIDGMSAAAAVLPEKGFGIVALANADGCRLPQALVFQSIDNVVFGDSTNRLDEFRARERFSRERLDFAEAERKRCTIPNTNPSRPLESYTGFYEDDFYGTASVALRDGKLQLRFIGFDGPLEHWQFDGFSVALHDPHLRIYKPLAVFGLDDYGEPSQLTLVILGGPRLKLERKHPDPTAISLSIERLRAHEGRWKSDLASLKIAIDLVGESLKVTVPGALAASAEDVVVATLIPVGEGRFAIAGTRSSLSFDGDAMAVLETPHQLPVTLTRR
jgi:CubicO group peptidase (beta-lactamase class C family)